MSHDGTPAFEMRNVGYAYAKDIVALDGVSLTIPRGAMVAIIGANGSGKSTLLRLLDGLYFPSAGQIVAFGERLTAKRLADDVFALAFRRRVGLLFQESDVQLFSPTVWDEVAFGPLHLGLAADEVEARVGAVLADFGLAHLAQRSPYRLSGGEKKKVALAAVLAVEPEALLLDEPTANLDPRSVGHLIDIVRAAHCRGRTIVTATHDLDIVEHIADWVYVLGEDKRLAAQGPAAEVLADDALLLATNLVHSHGHYHDAEVHRHPHRHQPPHH